MRPIEADCRGSFVIRDNPRLLSGCSGVAVLSGPRPGRCVTPPRLAKVRFVPRACTPPHDTDLHVCIQSGQPKRRMANGLRASANITEAGSGMMPIRRICPARGCNNRAQGKSTVAQRRWTPPWVTNLSTKSRPERARQQMTFQEELRALFDRHQVEFDED